MIKYFKCNVEDAVRIAVVEATDEDDVFSAPEAKRGDEISASDLPADFNKWQRYTAHSDGHGCTVNVMSRDGD